MGRPPGTTVFVGNISYETTEEQLKEVFSQVGIVVSFRLMYDHETGKAKGFGFCEYEDKETAMSARRNLNGTDLNGRSLRVDLTENDKQLASANQASANKAPTSRRHPALQGGLAGPNPSMARMTPREIHDSMLALKRAVEADPNEMRELLLSQPMHVHAILQGQIMLGMVPPPPMMRPPPPQMNAPMNPPMNPPMNAQMNPPMNAPMNAQMNPPMNPQMHPQMNPQLNPQMNPGAQHPQHAQMVPPHLAQQMGAPAAPQIAPPMRSAIIPPQMPGAAVPPQAMPPQQMGGSLPQLQRDEANLLAQVMNMTQQQINMLPVDQREKVLQLQSAVHSQQQQGQGGMPGQPPQRQYR